MKDLALAEDAASMQDLTLIVRGVHCRPDVEGGSRDDERRSVDVESTLKESVWLMEE